jgi:hypothetical protein
MLVVVLVVIFTGAATGVHIADPVLLVSDLPLHVSLKKCFFSCPLNLYAVEAY